MRTADFFIKQGDTHPIYRATLTDGTGEVVDLTTADSVRFLMRPRDGSEATVTATATFGTKADGEVLYAWTESDTQDAGWYDAEFEVTWNPGEIETFPNDRHLLIRIHPQITEGS